MTVLTPAPRQEIMRVDFIALLREYGCDYITIQYMHTLASTHTPRWSPFSEYAATNVKSDNRLTWSAMASIFWLFILISGVTFPYFIRTIEHLHIGSLSYSRLDVPASHP